MNELKARIEKDLVLVGEACHKAFLNINEHENYSGAAYMLARNVRRLQEAVAAIEYIHYAQMSAIAERNKVAADFARR